MTLTLAELRKSFDDVGYICDDNTVLTVYLSLQLQKPLLIEGAPGVGKTEMGKVLAEVMQTELIRLQCYEGLDENKALYEWNYQRQLLKIQMVLLIDEVDKCDPEFEAFLFEVLSDFQVSIPELGTIPARHIYR